MLIKHYKDFKNHLHHYSLNANLSIRSGKMSKLLEYDISNLQSDNIVKHMTKLDQLLEFAKLSRIQIKFIGLEEYKKINEQKYCGTWTSENTNLLERDMLHMLEKVQIQSPLSPRRYIITLVF